MTLVVQVNGKKRGEVTVSAEASKEEIIQAASADVSQHLQDKAIKKTIVVPGRLVNLVV